MNFLDFDTIPFGKYRGRSVYDLAKEDPGYLQWVLDNADHHWVDDAREMIRKALSQRYDDLSSTELTEHQQSRLGLLLDALDEAPQDYAILRLEGGAGYGKSYLTRALARELLIRGHSVAATAVSYVATEVLKAQVDELGTVACRTVASMLRLDKVETEDTESYEISSETIPTLEFLFSRGAGARGVLIVDECSMVNDEIAQTIFKALMRTRGVLLLVGDSHQLPPVKQDLPSVFCAPMDYGCVELTIPMRYSVDSDLYRLEQKARAQPTNVSPHAFIGSEEVVRAPTHAALIEHYVANYREFPEDLHRMLLFRRAQVTAANNAIRARLFGDDAAPIEPDEQLMVLRTADYEPGMGEPGPRMYSGVTFRVEDLSAQEFTIDITGTQYTIPHLVVHADQPWWVYVGEGQYVERDIALRVIFGINERQVDPGKPGGVAYREALKAATEYARRFSREDPERDSYGNRLDHWRYYKTLRNAFVQVAYLYCTSVHRAQGQTCDFAYTDLQELRGAPGLLRSALPYVALTRARKRITVRF